MQANHSLKLTESTAHFCSDPLGRIFFGEK
jgi:hypothetical protein